MNSCLSIFLFLGVVVIAILYSPIPEIYPEVLPLPDLPFLEFNFLLKDAYVLDEFIGPESFAMDAKGFLYTGLADGRIIKSKDAFENGKFLPDLNFEFEDFIRTGKDDPKCGTYNKEPICGRPLGMEYDKKEDRLLVIDAYSGLLSIGIEKKDIKVLCNSIAGKKIMLPNDLVTDEKTGIIYFTDSSARFQRRDIIYEVVEGGQNGRLLAYNPKNQSCNVVLDKLRFPNGLTTSHDGKNLLINSNTLFRIYRYNLETGKLDIFASNLPGNPDNIKKRPNGNTYYVALGTKRAQPFSLVQTLAGYPIIRRFLAKIVPRDLFLDLVPLYGLLVELNENGQIVNTMQDPTGVVTWISDVFEIEDYLLFLGSWRSPLAVLPLKNPTKFRETCEPPKQESLSI